jgi:hypothetical protein
MKIFDLIKTIVDTHIISILIRLKSFSSIVSRNEKIDEIDAINQVQNELIDCINMLEQLKLSLNDA